MMRYLAFIVLIVLVYVVASSFHDSPKSRENSTVSPSPTAPIPAPTTTTHGNKGKAKHSAGNQTHPIPNVKPATDRDSSSSLIEDATPVPPDFPYYTWEQKMKAYYAGRPQDAVPYPDGLDVKGIQQLSDNVFAIDHQALDRQIKEEDVMGQAKIDDKNGVPTFSEVVPGGVFDHLGILPGDSISAIDGGPIHSYADLYSASQDMRGKHEVTINIQRNGHNIQFTYFIQ